MDSHQPVKCMLCMQGTLAWKTAACFGHRVIELELIESGEVPKCLLLPKTLELFCNPYHLDDALDLTGRSLRGRGDRHRLAHSLSDAAALQILRPLGFDKEGTLENQQRRTQDD